MCREVHGLSIGFRIWHVGAAKVDFESKLPNSIFHKSGTSDEIGLREEYEGRVIFIEGGMT